MITIIRVLTIIFALSGLLGYEYGLFLTICALGILNIVYGVESFQNKKQVNAISSMLVGLCVLLFSVVQFCKKM